MSRAAIVMEAEVTMTRPTSNSAATSPKVTVSKAKGIRSRARTPYDMVAVLMAAHLVAVHFVAPHLVAAHLVAAHLRAMHLLASTPRLRRRRRDARSRETCRNSRRRATAARCRRRAPRVQLRQPRRPSIRQ